MPDPITILSAMGAALVASAVALHLSGWRGRKTGTAAVDIGWVMGAGAGFLLGCCMLGKVPHWPPVEDRDRLLFLVLPAVVVIELLGTFPKVRRWLIWPVRAALAAGVAPVLLHGTSYLSDQAGPGTADWSTAEACLILGGLAAFLITVWALLGLLSDRARGVSTAVCLAISSAGAGLAVMISGYMSGGQTGLALAGALSGVVVATLTLGWSSRGARPLGVAIVGLYSLVVIGRFFGELSSAHAILLFASPLLAWLPELPLLRRLPRSARNLLRVVMVGLFVSAIVVVEVRKLAESAPSSDDLESEDATAQEYIDTDLSREATR
jgi:hypothetical protein